MAFRLTTAEQKQRDEITATIHEAWDDLESAKSGAETRINEIIAEFETAMDAVRVPLDLAEEFRDKVASRLREEWDQKSESWQNSDKGQEADAFIQEWENASIDVTLEVTPADFEIDGDGAVEVIADLPVEME